MKKTVDIVVSGLVQGVGFRYYTTKLANQLLIQGFVENVPDGTVHIVASGEAIALNNFIQQIAASPSPYSKVTNIKTHYTTLVVDNGFYVKY
ncbi:acylphosphatase [Lentilactobacillus kosonis]|uniref:acylphosphatase n=1 Tax=Lentilactobacillus kosonis TaxID=2810561 RepID=A0A401FKE6_9LACO|nr:acylphosphatase [Lentilactobacillus kosonis]GAY72859.1 predicted nucleoside phosphatase [Lentilactobacillus kosonis]